MVCRNRALAVQDGAVQIELDDGLHLGNGLQLAVGIVFARAAAR